MKRSFQFVAAVIILALAAAPAATALAGVGTCAVPHAPHAKPSMACCPGEMTAGSENTPDADCGAPSLSCCDQPATPTNVYSAPAPQVAVQQAQVPAGFLHPIAPARHFTEARVHGSPPLAVLCSFLI